ncbi:MAG: protein-disulfide reductase DsbD family protein [Alphaproteobacteria bacterium]
MRILFLILSLFLTLSLPSNAIAQDPLVKIRILPEKGKIAPDENIWIAIEQSITPHWHTYWKNPGDSGTTPSITWTLPEGFEISEIHWPAPHKLPYGPLLNYGYEDKAILLQKLTAPETLPDGPLELTAEIELLVCKEECIPEYGSHPLTLNGPNAAIEDNSPYIQAARQDLPEKTNWPVYHSENNGDFVLNITAPTDILSQINLASMAFFPEEWGLLSNTAPVQALIQDNTLILKQTRGERAINSVKEFTGILSFQTMDGEKQNYEITTKYKAAQAPQTANAAAPAENSRIAQALLFALLGGLILNLMPCVFPVLSIKALSLVKIAEKHPEIARRHGLSYTAGVISSFLLIAGTLIALQTGGTEIGWGFQLQNPWIVGALSYLLFVIGLNLIGFFELANPFANLGGRLAQNEGLPGSFFTGILATLVATPCTAPFMAGAIGFAFTQPPPVSLTIFAALGLGLALPYLTLSFVPSLQKALPKPGPWMDIFKQTLAFPMFMAALWLLWVLAQQTDTMGITTALFGAILLTFSIWMFKHIPEKPLTHNITRAIAVLSVIAAFVLLPTKTNAPQNNPAIEATYSFGQPFSQIRLEQELNGDTPVFTEMTAAWCITCKVNHKIAINTAATKTLFAKHNVQYLIGDWTNEDPEITKYLQKHGRNGVPLYVYYGPRDPVTKQRPQPKLLPQVLTPDTIKNYIEGD